MITPTIVKMIEEEKELPPTNMDMLKIWCSHLLDPDYDEQVDVTLSLMETYVRYVRLEMEEEE